jgi:putative IMPACT (imprinted ancient) family translation regulator
LVDILVVIIRYFGGTKLGIGPLGKAYSETAVGLLNSADIEKLQRYEKIKIEYDFDQTNSIHFLLNKFKCKKIENHYEDSPIISALITPSKTQLFRKELIEKTSANARFIKLGEEVYLRI